MRWVTCRIRGKKAGNTMEIIATFFTESECFQFIESNLMTDVIIEKDIFSGQYNVLETG
jgi:hypothetical protein